jgi:hypothetical protein
VYKFIWLRDIHGPKAYDGLQISLVLATH